MSITITAAGAAYFLLGAAAARAATWAAPWAWRKARAWLPGRKTQATDVRRYTQADILKAVKAERHSCSIAVWMTMQDALASDADDKGLEGWMREAEQRVKGRQ